MLPNDTITDRQLADYLLGILPPDDAERLDEASIVDDDVARRLRTVEEDLVDAYARGRLDERTRRRFESHYLRSAVRRNQVSEATSFVRAIDSAAALQRSAFGGRIRRSAWPVLSLAATLLLVTCGALMIQNGRLNRELSVAVSDRVVVDRRANDLEQQLSNLRSSSSPRIQRADDTPPSNGRLLREAPIALVLLPATRATGAIPILTVPARADRVHVELQLESNDSPAYQLSVRDPAVNDVVWRSGWIGATSSSPGQHAVPVSIPVRVLKPQHYSFDLSGAASGSTRIVGSYAVEVDIR